METLYATAEVNMMDESTGNTAAQAVIRVGDGRGFVAEHEFMRIVITAAHCLADALLANGTRGLPPCHSGRYCDEETYRELLGPLGADPTVWATCLFIDPIADIAVLGQPDNQVLCEQAAAYDTLVDAVTPTPIADAPEDGEAWLLSLDRKWNRCRVQHSKGPLWITEALAFIRSCMSGSPIITRDGAAIGVISVSGGTSDIDRHTEGGPNPHLAYHLPNRFLPVEPNRFLPVDSSR
jgi:hypothetical protein